MDVLFSNIDDIIKVNSKLLQDLQETDAKEEEQVQLIGKQTTRPQSASGPHEVSCPRHAVVATLSPEFQRNAAQWESVFGIPET